MGFNISNDPPRYAPNASSNASVEVVVDPLHHGLNPNKAPGGYA